MATIHISEAEATNNFARAKLASVYPEAANADAGFPSRKPALHWCQIGHSNAGFALAISDLLIGVTALELGYRVATANVRHFQMISGLEIISF